MDYDSIEKYLKIVIIQVLGNILLQLTYRYIKPGNVVCKLCPVKFEVLLKFVRRVAHLSLTASFHQIKFIERILSLPHNERPPLSNREAKREMVAEMYKASVHPRCDNCKADRKTMTKMITDTCVHVACWDCYSKGPKKLVAGKEIPREGAL